MSTETGSEVPQSRLLSLPTELRTQIFIYSLENTRCRQPLVIWDSVHSTSRLASYAPKQIALLLTCQLIYFDCIGLLYDTTLVELSLRGDEPGRVSRHALKTLGRIENCTLLSRLRHVELEIMYEGSNHSAVHQTVARLRRLRETLHHTGKLKTIEFVFFDQGSAWRVVQGIDELVPEADRLVEQALGFAEFCRIKNVNRNIKASRSGMSLTAWGSLRAKVGDGQFEGQEDFTEINCDYWDRRFDRADDADGR